MGLWMRNIRFGLLQNGIGMRNIRVVLPEVARGEKYEGWATRLDEGENIDVAQLLIQL